MNFKKRVEKLEKTSHIEIFVIEYWIGDDSNLIKLCGKTFLQNGKNLKEEIYDKDYYLFQEQIKMDKQHWLDKWEKERDEKYEEYIERCAILEYDAYMTRKDAEIKALDMLIKKYKELLK